MTLDERLQYIATLQQTHDEQIAKLVEQSDRNENAIAALAARMGASIPRMDVLTERTNQAMDAINRLPRIAKNHENLSTASKTPSSNASPFREEKG